MNTLIVNITTVTITSLLLLTASGCQNTKALDEVRVTTNKAAQDAAAAKVTADNASTAATTANKGATNAQATADKALSTANQALQAAKTAQSGVDTTNEKMDRMFKQSVSK